MGGIVGLLGVGSGAAGTSFNGPQQAQITAPTNAQQVGQAYSGTQTAMGGQQGLLNALQAQNGLQNQSQVYGQLQGIASGAVNPAQAQFAQNTSQNVANQAALMAGQRGASQNVGLIARQAAQQGAATQQQAVGQEAAQQAQNQIGAIGAAGQLATTQAGQQIGQTNANTQAQQAEQSNLLNALQGYNSNQVASQASVNAANASMANTQLTGQQGLIGGVLGSAGLSGFSASGAKGGDVAPGKITSPDKMAMGGSPAPVQQTSGAQSEFGQFLSGGVQGTPAPAPEMTPMSQPKSGFGGPQKGTPSPASPVAGPQANPINSAAGAGATGAAPAGSALSLAGSEGMGGAALLGGANGGMAKDFRAGGKVKASSSKEKAVAKGNNYSNDKIPAVLSEHEIVLPRSVTLSKDPVGGAAKFVAQTIAKRKAGK